MTTQERIQARQDAVQRKKDPRSRNGSVWIAGETRDTRRASPPPLPHGSRDERRDAAIPVPSSLPQRFHAAPCRASLP